MKKVLLIIMILTSILLSDFTRGNGIVLDSTTKLMWQDNYNNEEIKRAFWKEAIEYCENLTLEGYKDWRLPNVRELKSIVDFSRSYPAINKIFKETETSEYWSSTTSIYSKNYLKRAVVVRFHSGGTSTLLKDKQVAYIRCVRGGL